MSQYYEILVFLFISKISFVFLSNKSDYRSFYAKKRKISLLLIFSPFHPFTHFLSLSPPPSYLSLFLCISLVFPFRCIFVCTYLQFYSVFGSFTFCHLVYHHFFSIILSVFLFSIFFSAYSLERRF